MAKVTMIGDEEAVKVTVNILKDHKEELETRKSETGIPEAFMIRDALRLYFTSNPRKKRR